MRNNHDIWKLPIDKNFTIGLHLFATHKQMLKFCNKVNYHVTKDTLAIYQPIEHAANIEGVIVGTPLLGVFCFNKEHINYNILSHEASHAGIDCMRRIKEIKSLNIGDGINDIEESLCYYIGDISESLIKLLKEYIS